MIVMLLFAACVGGTFCALIHTFSWSDEPEPPMAAISVLPVVPVTPEPETSPARLWCPRVAAGATVRLATYTPRPEVRYA